MRSLYEPLSRFTRAEKYRKDAQELRAAGFAIFAQVNEEIAYMLDPPKREESEYGA